MRSAHFRDRDLSATEYPYVFLDATYCKARVGHRVVSQAVVVAFGVAADGRREVLGLEVGDSENEGFWTAFLRSLKARGLDRVKLVISDAHSGLKKAISTVFQGRGMAALPGAFHAERALGRAEGIPGHGRLDHPYRLRPARSRARKHPVR
jgi:hypothetical protein